MGEKGQSQGRHFKNHFPPRMHGQIAIAEQEVWLIPTTTMPNAILPTITVSRHAVVRGFPREGD